MQILFRSENRGFRYCNDSRQGLYRYTSHRSEFINIYRVFLPEGFGTLVV
jgi:hypothetical protein